MLPATDWSQNQKAATMALGTTTETSMHAALDPERMKIMPKQPCASSLPVAAGEFIPPRFAFHAGTTATVGQATRPPDAQPLQQDHSSAHEISPTKANGVL